MCCFSGNVQRVANTRIFARKIDAAHQAIAYQMAFSAAEDLAMILPLPVVPGSKEQAVKFINLEGYPSFFDDLDSAFPRPRSLSAEPQAGGIPRDSALEVQSVGSFEASFVPTVDDFGRLDERFRIEPEIWRKIPSYHDFGFAVFKLKKGDHEVHPMALQFPSRHTNKLFFPTIHIHDGEVHAKEEFDHQIYCQVDRPGMFAMTKWDESPSTAKTSCKVDKSQNLLKGDLHLHRRRFKGMLDNEDIILGTT